MADQLRKVIREYPKAATARGWYQIGWSDDFAAGETRALHYFGCDLVAYRGSDEDGTPGAVRVFDAYCRHLGAHLAHGGTVEGSCLRCPYHGWLYDGDGVNVEVPYGDRRPRGVRVRTWPTTEVDGLVHVYFSDDSDAPPLRPPTPFVDPASTWVVATEMWQDQALVPQFAADNVCDAAHFKFVHGSNDVAVLERYVAEPDVFRASYRIAFGAGLEQTWATPSGPVEGTIETESWGIGLLRNTLGGVDGTKSLLGITPVDDTTSEVRLSVWVPTLRADASPLDARLRDRWVGQQRSQVEADLSIWAHQTYVEQPPLVAGEAVSMRAYRTWARALSEGSTSQSAPVSVSSRSE